MPEFCRHGRFVQNCRICSPNEPPATASRSTGARGRGAGGGSSSPPSPGARSGAPGSRRRGAGMVVRRVGGAVADGYVSPLVAGLHASGDARRLAGELAFSTARLAELAADPPGLYADVALTEDAELGFLIAYLGPLEGFDDPFGGVRAARDRRSLADVPVGPRHAHDPARGERTWEAFRAWAARPGALTGDLSWSPERRFDRLFERLALPGLDRGARFDLLVSLGRLGLVDAQPGHLHLGGDDPVTVSAKRAFGIGDKFELDKRARALAEATGVPLAALDLALWNFAGPRATMGSRAEPDPALRAGVEDALGL